MLDLYQPTGLISNIIAIIFYLLMAGFVIYSILAISALFRFGRSNMVAIVVSLFYIIIAASIYAVAVTNLHKIQF